MVLKLSRSSKAAFSESNEASAIDIAGECFFFSFSFSTALGVLSVELLLFSVVRLLCREAAACCQAAIAHMFLK
jgi:hypothetical protein